MELALRASFGPAAESRRLAACNQIKPTRTECGLHPFTVIRSPGMLNQPAWDAPAEVRLKLPNFSQIRIGE